MGVGIGEMMGYEKYGGRYNWKLVRRKERIRERGIEDKERREEVGRLMGDIGEKVNMKYECCGSGCNIYNGNNGLISYG